MREFDTNLYLVGFMGTGKTTVGRAVAQKLGFTCLDSDAEIERRQGMGITEIFAQQGEAAFREMEKTFITSGHPTTRCVVACGGGLVVQPGMLELLRSRGVVACLHASLETILKRTQGSKHRPLITGEEPLERLKKLYAAREPIYRRSGTVILTEGRPVAEVVTHLLRIYRREAADWTPPPHADRAGT